MNTSSSAINWLISIRVVFALISPWNHTCLESGKYLQIAMEDIQDSFKVVLEPDGGYLEGPSYFCATARRHCQTLDYYARAKGSNVLDLVPKQLRRTGDYAQAVASTTRYDYLPICDCDWGTNLETWLWLARVMPDSYWVTLAQKSYANHRNNQQPGGEGAIPPNRHEGPELKPFVHLPDTGYIASHRKLSGHWVKIFIMGNRANAGTHTKTRGVSCSSLPGRLLPPTSAWVSMTTRCTRSISTLSGIICSARRVPKSARSSRQASLGRETCRLGR